MGSEKYMLRDLLQSPGKCAGVNKELQALYVVKLGLSRPFFIPASVDTLVCTSPIVTSSETLGCFAAYCRAGQ